MSRPTPHTATRIPKAAMARAGAWDQASNGLDCSFRKHRGGRMKARGTAARIPCS